MIHMAIMSAASCSPPCLRLLLHAALLAACGPPCSPAAAPAAGGALLLPAAFSAADCERIVRLGVARAPPTDGKVAGTATDEIRASRLRAVPRDGSAEVEWLYGRLAALVRPANVAVWGYASTDFEPVQLAEYTAAAGGHYGTHADVNPAHAMHGLSEADRDGLSAAVGGRQRVLSLSVQLSPPSDYAGGKCLSRRRRRG
jgi:hypothetical protein